MASWNDPTGELPVIDVPPTRQQPTVRSKNVVDRALIRVITSVLIVTLAVGGFIFFRSRADSSGASTPPTTVTVPVSTTIKRRASVTTAITEPVTTETSPTSTTEPPTTTSKPPPTITIP